MRVELERLLPGSGIRKARASRRTARAARQARFGGRVLGLRLRPGPDGVR
jgi:hypothetical protein